MLTEEEVADIILASAHSRRPLRRETVRRIADECGHDADLLEQRHEEFRASAKRKKDEDDKPMPFI